LLSVSNEKESALHPTVNSTGCGEGFWEEFGRTGIRDATPWLAVTAAIDFSQGLEIEAARTYMHDLENWAGDKLVTRWGTERGASSMLIAAMVTVRVPANWHVNLHTANRLHDYLLHQHRIEAPVFPIGDALWVWFSAQVYNNHLASAVG